MTKSIFFAACMLAGSGSFAQTTPLDSLERALAQLTGVRKAAVLYETIHAALRSDMQKARLYHAQAKAELSVSKDPGAVAYLKMALGIYAARTGLLDSGAFYLNEAKEAAVASDNHKALARIYLSLGHTYISAGKPQKGLENMFEGLRVLRDFPEQDMEMKLRTNVAWAYLELKQYRNCIDYGLENLKVMEGTSMEWIALYTYNNIAVSYGALGLLDSARYYIDKGIQAAIRSNDHQSLANGYFILGTIFSEAGKYDLAIEQYLKARPYREKVGNPLFIVSDLYSLSELYHRTGEYSKGIQAGMQALEIARKYDLQLKYEHTYEWLARNYQGLKDYRNSSKYFELWAAAKDSVYKNASAASIAEMRTRYETEKKEQQLALQQAQLEQQRIHIQNTYIIIGALAITLLFGGVILLLLRGRSRRKRELALREAQIQAALESQESERRRFARDLHDGMGQLISALRLALHRINKQTPLEERVEIVSRAEDLLNDMHQEIRSIAFNLMPATLVQSGLIPALKEMGNRISESGKVTIRVQSFDMANRLSEVHEISLYRIIQEWINNVCKYADATTIDVQFVGYDDEINVLIEDNGTGFDPTVLQRASGNGWKNIRSRLNLIKGTLDIDSRAGRRGTTLMLRIPLALAGPAAEIAVAPNTT